MSNACAGQVWEDMQDGHVYMVIDRPSPWSDWRMLLLATGHMYTTVVPGTVTWAGDLFFGASWTRRIA